MPCVVNMCAVEAFVWMADGSVSLDRFQTERVPEAIRDVYRGFAHGVACAVTGFGGSGLDAIQAILAANREKGRGSRDESDCLQRL